MKVTIKFKSKDKIEPLITFLQELTGKDFKEVNMKSVCSKMEPSEHPEITPNYNDNYKNIEVKDEEVLKFPELEKAVDEYNKWIIQSSKKRWKNCKDFQDKINSLSKVDPVNVSKTNRLFPEEIENYKKLEDCALNNKDSVKETLNNSDGTESVKCDECNQKKDGLAHIIYANGKHSTICDGCRLKNIEIIETPSGPTIRYSPVNINEPIENVKELIRSLTDTNKKINI